MTDEDDVRHVLERYRELYEARDLSRLDEALALFAPGDEPEMVGTEAVARGDADWAVGAEAVRTLTEWDWRWWWDVDLDVGAARISVSGDVAWASVPGGLVASGRALRGVSESAATSTVPRLRDLLDEPAGGARGAAGADSLVRRLDEVSRLAAARVRELRAAPGERRPMTLTAVLVRRDDHWLLHTTHWAIAAE
jgi:hypothetical protein